MARFSECLFGATHNSYSGKERGSLEGQLSSGIRCIELDFHDNGYHDYRDYRVGHMAPGHEVAVGGGNPTALLLRDWLSVIATWSSDHQGHGPITLVLDGKDDLTDNDHGGDLEDLNQTLEGVFGLRLFSREQFGVGPWPDIAQLKDKVLCILSGHGGTRVYYRWTRGSSPSIGVTAEGRVVLVYQATASDLRCWTGTVDPIARRLRWQRRATYKWNSAPLSDPAVAVNDDGWVVAVHCVGATTDFPTPVVESCIGRLQVDGRITWFSSNRYALGRAPTVRISGDDVRSVHLTPDGKRSQLCLGKLDRQKQSLQWGPSVDTTLPLLPRDSALWQSRALKCAVTQDGVISAAFDFGPLEPVRFRQLAFVERQKGDDQNLLADSLFFAAEAKSKTALRDARLAGSVVRAWVFEPGDVTTPPANMPATNEPASSQYAAYLAQPDVTA